MQICQTEGRLALKAQVRYDGVDKFMKLGTSLGHIWDSDDGIDTFLTIEIRCQANANIWKYSAPILEYAHEFESYSPIRLA